MIYTQLHNKLMELYLKELRNNYSGYSSEHTGVLHLSIDSREDVKGTLILPAMSNYKEYMAADDGNDDDIRNIIIPTDERAETILQRHEALLVEYISNSLNWQPKA